MKSAARTGRIALAMFVAVRIMRRCVLPILALYLLFVPSLNANDPAECLNALDSYRCIYFSPDCFSCSIAKLL